MTNTPVGSGLSVDGVNCKVWTWSPPTVSRGLVVIFHGLGAHGRFPTVSVAAEAIFAAGFTAIAPDLPGHGASDGLRGFLYSAPSLEEAALAFVRAAREAHPDLPLFLLGSSMGGALCVRCALALAEQGIEVSGLVLLAPMLAPAASPTARVLLSVLSYTPLCRLALIPTKATSNATQYADADKAAEIDRDVLSYKGALRVGSASTVLELGKIAEESVEHVSCPFFCLLAEREHVLGPAARQAAERLFANAATQEPQCMLKRYDALHGLLCSEEPLRSVIVSDILSWLCERAAQSCV